MSKYRNAVFAVTLASLASAAAPVQASATILGSAPQQTAQLLGSGGHGPVNPTNPLSIGSLLEKILGPMKKR